jgi:hypothetical protein
MTTINSIDALAILASSRLGGLSLASGKASAAVREAIAEGDHDVDLTVRLRGTVRVGAPSEAEVSVAAPWRDLALSLLARVSPATRGALLRDLLSVSDGKVTVTDDGLDGLKGREDAALAVAEILGMTTRTVAGKVTGKIAMEVE